MVHFTFVDRSFDELTSPSIVDEFMVCNTDHFDCLSSFTVVQYLCGTAC